MPEPIGGREFKWELSGAFSRFGAFLNGLARVLGWALLLVLPIAGVIWVYLEKCMPAHGMNFPIWNDLKGYKDQAFLKNLLQLAKAWGILIVCFVCSVVTSVGFLSHFFSRKRMSNSEETTPPAGSAPGRVPDSLTQKTKPNATDTALPSSSIPVDSAEQSKRKTEVEAKKQEEYGHPIQNVEPFRNVDMENAI
jgi:hypothetical protein